MTPLELKENRKRIGLTQDGLAKELGVDRRTIINYEQGEVIPESKVKLLHIIFNGSKDVNEIEVTLIEVMAIELLKNLKFREGIREIQKEISTQELRAEIERMIKETEKDKVTQK